MKKLLFALAAGAALSWGVAMTPAQAASAGGLAPLKMLEGQSSTQLVQHHRRRCRTVCHGHGHHRRCRRVCHGD